MQIQCGCHAARPWLIFVSLDLVRDVYLIGVDHRFQRIGSLGLPEEVTHEFVCKLKELVHEHQIRGIAEEMSIDGLGIHRAAGGSVPFFVARELGLPHRYCDPSKEIKQRLGIKANGEREKYWLEQLRTFTGYPCLFILGATHTSSFLRLLNDSGFRSTVLFDDWLPATPLEQT
jgi:hypothetical protein